MIALDLLPKKSCSKCEMRLPISRFYGDRRAPDKHQACCKACSYAVQRKTIAKRADHYRTIGRNWQDANRLAAKTHSLMRTHGIDVDEYLRLLAAQGDCCAICRRPHEMGRDFHVDHCHATGRIRGVLCHHCNTGIGLLGESAERMRAAITYLDHGAPK